MTRWRRWAPEAGPTELLLPAHRSLKRSSGQLSQTARRPIHNFIAAACVLIGMHAGVFVHSLAFGTLRPFVPPPGSESGDLIGKSHIEMTCDVMAHSLLYWTQDLVSRGLIGRGSRLFAMTSAGGHRVIGSYGAVSAARLASREPIRARGRQWSTST